MAKPLLAELVKDPACIEPQFKRHGGKTYGRYMLHRARLFNVTSVVWGPWGGSRYVYAFPCLMAPRSGCRGIARLEVSKRERGRRRVVARRKYRAGQGRVARVRFVVARRKLHTMRNRNGDLWLFVKVRSTDAAGVTHVSESFPFTAQP